MDSIKVIIEAGSARTFAIAVDWPGWCRSGRNELSALSALIDYCPRYAQVLQDTRIGFQCAIGLPDLKVVERLTGNKTTNFGAPAIPFESDKQPVDHSELERFKEILLGCWRVFNKSIRQAAGLVLRKGPRGGGRDQDKLIQHVLEADQQYLKRLAWKSKDNSSRSQMETLERTRQELLNALDTAVGVGLPVKGPRGGVIWTPRYFVRRVAWHVLDHAWEIEDRIP